MKLKYWLMAAFLIVMLLPVVSLYCLYVLLSQYDQKQDLLEYVDVSNKISGIEAQLQNEAYYDIQPGKQYDALERLAGSSVKITLYRYDAITLFSSGTGAAVPSLMRVNRDSLYSNLNELQKNYRSYSVKKPVFSESKLLGFYEITIARNQWRQAVKHRTFWTTAAVVLFFVMLYAVILYFIRRKFGLPLRMLMKQMTAFAHDQPVQPIRHKSNDEIGELIDHFARMREQIMESREVIKREQHEKEYIAASLSHDLKTPLTLIRAYTELLKEKRQLGEREREEYFSILLEKTDYMKQLLDDLAMYSALKSSYYEMEQVEVDGDELFDMLLSGYDELCARNAVDLQKEICVQGVVSVHVSQVVRVVDNLMSNAIRHTKPNGRISLGALSETCDFPSWLFPTFRQELAEWRKGGVILIVQNEGEPVTEANRDKVFEPFYQADASRTKTKSGQSGLGLSIAKIIMDKHKGKIALWSAEGYGTLAACWLPAGKGEAE